MTFQIIFKTENILLSDHLHPSKETCNFLSQNNLFCFSVKITEINTCSLASQDNLHFYKTTA